MVDQALVVSQKLKMDGEVSRLEGINKEECLEVRLVKWEGLELR